MATFYIGYRHVLKGRTEGPNTFTGKTAVYSNWDLMYPDHVLDGAPDNNHVPGSGPYGQGDVTMSRWFLGLDVPFRKSRIDNPGISHPDIYQGRFPFWQWFGVPGAQAFSMTYGHLPFPILTGVGPMAAYAEWSNYFYFGLPVSHVLDTASLGHVERYPEYYGAGQLGPFNSNPDRASSFGAFEPYLYKGLVSSRSAPMIYATGHPEYAPSLVPDLMPSDYGQIPPQRVGVEHYGFEHVREWFGVPSAKALDAVNHDGIQTYFK